MRLGCCGSLDQAEVMAAAGFDFIEVNVQQVLLGQEDDAAWQARGFEAGKYPLPMEAANCLLPGALPVIGPTRNVTALDQYMDRVARRAAKLGIHRLVFGSGAARRRPEAVDPERAQEDLLEFLMLAGKHCGRHGVTLVIEHLNRGETNTINSLAEASDLVDLADDPAVAMLVDSYHYGLEKEDDASLLDLGERLVHVHVAEVADRLQPGGHGPIDQSPQAFDFDHFFTLLHKIGYNGRVSIECQWRPELVQAGAAAAAFVREAWRQAGRVEA